MRDIVARHRGVAVGRVVMNADHDPEPETTRQIEAVIEAMRLSGADAAVWRGRMRDLLAWYGPHYQARQAETMRRDG